MRKNTRDGIYILIIILFLIVIGYLILNGREGKEGEEGSSSASNEATEDKVNVNNNVNVNTNANVNEPSTGIANPASVKCQDDGGVTEIITGADGGQFGLCVFSDQSICEEWAYFRGECKQGKCFKECENIGTKSEGWYNSCTNELLKYDQCGPKKTVNNTAANIILTSPIADAQLSSPFKVEGTATAPIDKVYIRVKSKAGSILIEESAIVFLPDVGNVGNFKIDLSYDFSLTKEGIVEVYSLGLNNEEANLVSIPVKF